MTRGQSEKSEKDQNNAVSRATSSTPFGYVDRREMFKIIMKAGEKGRGLNLHINTITRVYLL
jgi:hypothetical protein